MTHEKARAVRRANNVIDWIWIILSTVLSLLAILDVTDLVLSVVVVLELCIIRLGFYLCTIAYLCITDVRKQINNSALGSFKHE